jgi:hypothetical protein
MEASNSCARTLIFGSVILLSFVKFFSLPLFCFFDLVFYCLFSFFWFVFFIALCFPLLFHSCFVPFFLAHVVLSLAYSNLLENKRLGCCCCCCCIWLLRSILSYIIYSLHSHAEMTSCNEEEINEVCATNIARFQLQNKNPKNESSLCRLLATFFHKVLNIVILFQFRDYSNF